MKRYDWDALSAEERVRLLERPALADDVVLQKEVATIVQRVRRGGDAALMALTQELDGIDLSNLSVSEQEFEKATEYTKAIMRRTCLEFVTAFHGQLQPVDPTAKKKRPIHSTTLNKLVDFMETFSVRNISGDEQMVEAITTMKSLLSGVTVNQLRSSESFRGCIESHISDAVLDIGKLVEDCPVRQIILDD